MGPVQNRVGIAREISITVFGVQATLDANPNFGLRLIQCNLKNGYNEISREGVLNAMRDTGKLDDTLAFSQALLEPRVYIGMGSGTVLSKAPFFHEEEVHQEEIESS